MHVVQVHALHAVSYRCKGRYRCKSDHSDGVRTKELHDMGDEWQEHYEDEREKEETKFEKLTKDEVLK